MEIDFGGVVKEYAVDRAATFCWEAGARSGYVNLGGDIKIIGSSKRSYQDIKAAVDAW
jgi:FAD:protein FMN transferase